MGGQGAGADLHFRDLGEGRLQGADELGFELGVDLASGIVALDVAADVGIEQQRIGDAVGVHAAAADRHVQIQVDLMVHHTEGDGRGGAELVVHDLLGVEVVDALILAGVAAEGEALADELEGFLQAVAKLAGEDAGLGGGIIGKLAGLGADLHDFALLHDDHALAVGHCDEGAVGDDIVVALGVARAGGDPLLPLDHEGICIDGVTIEEFLPLIGQNAAHGADSCLNESHSIAPFRMCLIWIGFVQR